MFKSKLLKGSVPKQVRFTLEYSDDLSEANKAIINFYDDLNVITSYLIATNPDYIPAINNLISLIETEFHIDADHTQSASIESDLEIKTKTELQDKNRDNLQEHLKDIYGIESWGIIQGLYQDFYDDVIGAAYYNIKTGEPVDADNKVLNKNIQALKSKYLDKIKTYLDEKGIQHENGLYDVLRVFYEHIKSIPDFKKQLNSLQADKVKQAYLDAKKTLFKNLLSELESDPNFVKAVLQNLNKYKKNKLAYSLFDGDCYSDSYLAVRKYVLEKRPDLKNQIEAIELEQINLLEATNAYSMLTHFDSLLFDRIGSQIAVEEGTEGLEVEDKYSFHQDTSHEIKGWQTSEDIGSERHTSNFAKGVFSVIRIYDHHTGDYKHRRLDSTSFIIAARHLLDDILYGNIKIQGKGDAEYVKRCRQIITENIVTFHEDPQEKFQQILELLFDTKEGFNIRPMKEFLSNKRLLTDNDLDILYSIYHKVFNTNNPTSFISHEMQGFKTNSLGASLMQEIAAYVDSNITMDYMETSVDYETGEIQIKVKKKYFNNAQLYKLRQAINADVNRKSLEQRQVLQDQYNFHISSPADRKSSYSVKIGDAVISLNVENESSSKILSANEQMSFDNKELFDAINKIDLIEFRQEIESGGNFSGTPDQIQTKQQLRQLLQFIDDFLNLNILSNLGLQNLYVYKSLYTEINGMKNFLMPLMQMAIRAAYVNSQYLNAGDQKLATYLKDDSIYKAFKANPKSKLFIESYGNVKYVAASYNDKVLDMWVDAMSILTGQASKATTKDGQGNSIPNNSVGKLGGILHYYLHKQQGTNCDTLMFVNDPEAIKSTFHDLESTNIHGSTKNIKQFSCGELFFHSIFNKFWGSYNKNGNVVIQPTVYSDKTTFLNWEIKTDLLEQSDYVGAVVKQYMLSLGSFYRKVYKTSMGKLNTLAQYYNETRGVNLSIKEFLKLHNEKSLMSLSQEMFKNRGLKIDLEKDKDYRERKKKVIVETVNADGTITKEEKTQKWCTINEILEYNDRVYNNEALLREALENEKYNFLQNLIDYNTSFQVIDFNDDISYYLSKNIDTRASSTNSILSTILKTFKTADERIEFFKNWVDAKTGKLILAKQGNQNILGISNDFNKNLPGMILNPFLDKFFYVEGLLSNNLRMSLTGSEINHPDKAFGTLFNNAKAAASKSYGDFLELIPNVTFEQFQEIKTILDQCDDVLDLEIYDHPVIKMIYNKSIIKIVNTAQGTQFKRNVIIPATLQYCQQGTRNGVGKKIKCAVIYDEEAPVHNYRGETKEIESADGSAQINPFQSILENLSLGSQAVGFIKKPIWHSYDTSGGTAFLAKFATDTITNESMRASIQSGTSLYKMFRRMTNLQWTESIDLTKGIFIDKSLLEESGNDQVNKLNSKSYDSWFNKVILENQNLFYENQFGDKVQIISFKKTVTDDGTTLYYTVEKTGDSDPVKVYHMFEKDTSKHHTFSTYQKALEFKQQTGSHTINSLFELHTALGGINCVDSKGNGSEFNNKVVVNFMNNIGTRKEGVPKNALVNQKNYYQPLKDQHIGYALNNTAVKNGAKNVNPAEAWKGDTELTYFEVDSDGLGMQMNADHDIVDSELTEFSQVIAATAAYGYTYGNCNEIFKGLAKTALQASKQVIDATNRFLQDLGPQAQSDLYDAIGRIVLVERSIKDRESLTGMIMEAVSRVFNKNKNHKEDVNKIPFSDPNIYSEFISTLASSITKASIKRKHPGSGCVMVPGYNMITYFEFGDKKYSHKEVLKLARTELKDRVLKQLQQIPEYNSELDELDDVTLKYASLQQLLSLASKYNLLDPATLGVLSSSDIVTVNKALIQSYLESKQEEAPYYDRAYFQPEDVVIVHYPDGSKSEPLVLDTMEKYYAFKEYPYDEGTRFQIDVMTPRNLKPSLIRWQYKDALDNTLYMNIFDHPIIRESFKKGGKLDATYRKNLQQVFHDLHDGFFYIDGVRYEIIPNSLENTEAELVMSNIYKDVFGVDNETLQEILDQGEQYFADQMEYKMHTPNNRIYDVAMLKDNGKHTLIKFGEVTPNAYCVENKFQNISVNEQDEIYCMKGNRPLFKIGKWVSLTDEEADDLQIDPETGDIISISGKDIDASKYRINQNRIQKRIDFITRYKLTTKQVNRKTGQVHYTTNTMYKIINKDDLAKLFGNEADAHKQIGDLLKALYKQDNYKFIELNPLKGEQHLNQIVTIKGYLGRFLGDNTINEDHRNYLKEQLDSIEKVPGKNFAFLAAKKREFYAKEAHKKWVSFQDSLKFISSRIPAQTLQSFMTMKCVGWTENTKNMAYVSHFQTYLQGSDYDIDKAYIMGQSYDGNGTYIQWSPLFDFTDATTLSISKQLPVPEKLELIKIDGGIDVTEELTNILDNTDAQLIPPSYEQRILILKNYVSILNKINKGNGQITYSLQDSSKIAKVFDKIRQHIFYEIPENVAEAAYKNVASANIYAVSHDVRNRDQSYTAITMKILQKAAEKSPKGEQAASLNMLNPLTKYIMQYQNLVGKNVISIAANGEKVWFNAYYYWTKLLKEGRPKYLQFQTTLKRVNGRSKLNPNNLQDLEQNARTVKALPDLNYKDIELKETLLSNFGIDLEAEEYAYVDQLISQLLSAATDNAKELILAKINSGSNFARMYVYLIMTGYNFDDIVSFMISPASEFIDSMANSNMFQDSDLQNNPTSAINLARGIIRSKSFLHGTIKEYYTDENTGDTDYKNVNKGKYVLNELLNSEYIEEVRAILGLDPEQDVYLDTLMQGFIRLSIQNPSIQLTSLIDTYDTEINSYLQYCQNIAYKLSSVVSQYSSIDEMLEDVNEFGKIYQLSTEISGIASAWLGLNQGLPTDELGLLQRFARMRSVIIKREKALEIYPSRMFTDSEDPKKITKAQEEFNNTVTRIVDNNPALSREFVEQQLIKAHEKNLIGTFDIYRYLTDEQYKQDMIEYNHIIKGTLNVLDMMEEIPHYKEILNCLKSLAVSKHTLAAKSRLINKLIEDSDSENLNDQQLKGIIRYVDKLTAVNFAKNLKKTIVLDSTIEGFDRYFERTKTDRIDLSTFEGLATLKHWVEHEVLEDLRKNYSDNPLVQHLVRVPENQRDILATDIDLLNPNTTTVTTQSYNEILSGMAEFEKVDNYKGTGWTIADLFQMYNILVNNNQYGGERLTTTFKACSKPDSILNQYLNFEATQDYDYTNLPDYELIDYYINAAPIVNTVAERFRTDKFIKVNDPVEGYILKQYDSESNSYVPYQMVPSKKGFENNESRLQRLQNFAEYCPFEMPTMAKVVEMFSAIDFEGDIQEDTIERIKNILLDFSSVGKLIAFKNC